MAPSLILDGPLRAQWNAQFRSRLTIWTPKHSMRVLVPTMPMPLGARVAARDQAVFAVRCLEALDLPVAYCHRCESWRALRAEQVVSSLAFCGRISFPMWMSMAKSRFIIIIRIIRRIIRTTNTWACGHSETAGLRDGTLPISRGARCVNANSYESVLACSAGVCMASCVAHWVVARAADPQSA